MKLNETDTETHTDKLPTAAECAVIRQRADQWLLMRIMAQRHVNRSFKLALEQAARSIELESRDTEEFVSLSECEGERPSRW